MATWYARPPHPNDIIAGALFDQSSFYEISDNSGSFQDLPHSFSWQTDSRTTYELLIGPFQYVSSETADIIELQFTLTDSDNYSISLSNDFVCSSTTLYYPMWSRIFFAPASVTLTATFSIRRRLGTGFVTFRYGINTDPTLMGVRAIGQIDQPLIIADSSTGQLTSVQVGIITNPF